MGIAVIALMHIQRKANGMMLMRTAPNIPAPRSNRIGVRNSRKRRQGGAKPARIG